MTKLILVRHGHVEGITPERFRGRAALPLTEQGRREAEMTAAYIAASWRPAAIVRWGAASVPARRSATHSA